MIKSRQYLLFSWWRVKYCLGYGTCFAEAPYSWKYSRKHGGAPFMPSLFTFEKLLGLEVFYLYGILIGLRWGGRSGS